MCVYSTHYIDTHTECVPRVYTHILTLYMYANLYCLSAHTMYRIQT